MQKNPVYFDFVDVADEKVFTKQRMREWEVNLAMHMSMFWMRCKRR